MEVTECGRDGNSGGLFMADSPPVMCGCVCGCVTENKEQVQMFVSSWSLRLCAALAAVGQVMLFQIWSLPQRVP